MIQKFTFAIAFVLLAISNSFSQAPVNDVCADAITLTVNGGWTATSNSNTVTNSANPSCGGSSAIRDVWFKFVYGGGTVSIATQLGTNTDTRLAVYTSCGGTQLACNDDITGSLTSLITLSCPTLVLGNTYYIQAGGYNSIVGTFNIGITASGILGCTNPNATNYSACAAQDDGSCVFPTLTAQFNYAPTGTNCLNIQYTSTSSGNITGYNWSFPGGTPSSSTLANPVVTYPSAGTYSASLTITDANNNTNSATNNAVNVISGDIVTVDITPDGNPAQTSWKLFDSSNAIVAQGTTNDATICISNNCHRFEIYDTGNNGLNGAGNYRIYLNGLEVANGQAFSSVDIRYVNCPEGISCDNAIVANLGIEEVPFDNTWYVFTPAVNGQYKISTCSLASCDTKIWIYDYCTMANFDDSNEATYTYNDDLCGIQAESNVFMTGGDTYYIRVGSIGECSGQSYQVLFEYTGAITGCMDINACNYNPLAGLEGVCYYNGDPNCTGLGPDLEVSLSDLYSSLTATTVNGTDGCLVNEGCLQGLGTRSVLRFTTRISNIGTQDYYIGVPNAGNPQFEYDACHNHYHYEGYAEYLLFNPQGEPMPQIGFKNGFCVLDLSCPSNISGQYSCGNMGITAGCADYYSSSLACQWIDVTDVPAGDYYLVVRTNWDQSPDKNGRYELRYDNNWAQICVHFDKDANNNLINFTKNISTCPVIEDCLGVPFGDTYPDCEGTCPGVVIKGDINQDGYFTMIDEHTYAEVAVYGGVAVSPCTDLNNDGEITVADAAYAGACIHLQQDLGVPPLLYTECPYDDEILDQSESATLGVMNLNTAESYFDLYIINPDNEISALQVDFSGVELSSVENLLSNAVWNAHIHPEVGGNSLAVLGDGPTYIPINVSPTPILRVHYSSLTSNTVCVSNIIDILNDFNHNIITVYGDCQSVIPNMVADFEASSTSICSGQSVTFTDLSTSGATAWLWSFPGGTPSTSTNQNPTVTYNNGGSYSVTLTATGPQGNDQEIKTNYIQVGSAVAWYYDGDGDEFGNTNITVFACVAPNQFVSANGDCNDSNGAIYPGAIEICNNLDDDCDGSIDEGFDLDNDGFTVCEGDCDDNNMLAYPGAFELCNGVDDDCDGTVDDGYDLDNDGYTVCAGDCNDNNASVYPGAIEICNNIDDDCDGNTDEGFDLDADGYTACQGDCDDGNASVNPGAQEICNNIDDNCDGNTDEGFDADNDGYTTCNGDCNDNNAAVNPGAPEICNNIDDDCDGNTDEGFDLDADGYSTCEGDCNDNNAAVNPGAPEICNNIDDDCDGNTDEGFDIDGDGYSTCEGDCNDDNSAMNPGATEICNNVDDDCDGNTDEGFDLDSDGYTTCQGDCDDENASVNPGTSEICNTIDDDCDGNVDEGFDIDGDGYTVCEGDCNDNNALVNPGAAEVCNGIDDNCNLTVDENTNSDCAICIDGTLVGTSLTWYEDSDSDGFGNPDNSLSACEQPVGYIAAAGDCDDDNASVNPLAIEICNGLDDNCNGQLDEGFDMDGDGYTSCNGDCDDNNDTVNPDATEICNGIDDDCDSSIDEGTSTECLVCIEGQLTGTTSTWYADTDNDGFGNSSVTLETCIPPIGYIATAGDCDDTNASVNPGVSEICNGIDDDCDGNIDEGFDIDGDGYTTCEGDCDDTNENIHPDATETCNGIDDNCNGQTDEGVGQTWYVDADNDGYGDINTATNACTPPIGYISQGGDCNDNNASINPAATDICFNGIDEDCDGIADDGCPAVANDWKEYAVALNVGAYNTCNSTSGNIALATTSPEAQSTALTGQDLWYSFTPLSPGVQIKVSTASFNALVELQDNAGVMIDAENIQSVNGNEFLNIGNLTVGQQYYISVRNFNSAQGTGNFSICLSDLPTSGCLTPAPAYSMCSKFKAIVVNASNYVYNFTSTQTNITYSKTQPSATLDLYKVMNMPTGSNYVARVDASYTVNRGNGTQETIVITGPSACEFSFNADPLLILATTQDCPNPRPLGVNVRSNTTVCYASNYQWEFQKADLSEPVFSFNGGSTQYLMITSGMGFVGGTTYNVRIRVTYQNGYTNPWGPWKCLLISGGAGMAEYFDEETGEYSFDRNEIGLKMSLYPNPTDGNSINLEIAGVESGLVNATLTDGLGRLIESRQFNVEGYLLTEWIFENKLSSGIYLLDITHDDKRITQRIVVE